MLVYILSMREFKIVVAAEAISYELPLEASTEEQGTVVIAGTKAAGNEGNWLCAEDGIWIIKSIIIEDGKTEINVIPAINVFDRPLFFSGEYTSIEQFLQAQITNEFRNCKDALFSMPYLSVDSNTETPFIAPSVDENQMYNLKDYIQKNDIALFDSEGNAEMLGVSCRFSVLGAGWLRIILEKNSPQKRKIIYNNNTAEVVEQAHDNNAASKVSVIAADGTIADYYISKWGEIKTDIEPSDRLQGKWLYVKAGDDEDSRLTAVRTFQKNRGSHKVEFLSTEKYHVHDTVEMYWEGGPKYGENILEITCVRISADDNRYHYTCGDMPVTLTDRVGKATTLAGSGKASPADYVVARGTTGRWSWAKYASGLAECWGVFGDSMVEIKSAWGSVYYGGWMSTEVNKNGRKYPFEFKAAPAVTAQYIGGNGDAWLAADVGNNVNELTHAPAFSLLRPSAGTIYNPRIAYHAIGRWK